MHICIKNQTKAGARPGDPTSPRDSHRTRGKITKTKIYIYIYIYIYIQIVLYHKS